jgi:hypothetical protein
MLSKIFTLLSRLCSPKNPPELREEKADSQISSTMVVVQALWNGLSSHPTNKIRGIVQSTKCVNRAQENISVTNQ